MYECSDVQVLVRKCVLVHDQTMHVHIFRPRVAVKVAEVYPRREQYCPCGHRDACLAFHLVHVYQRRHGEPAPGRVASEDDAAGVHAHVLYQMPVGPDTVVPRHREGVLRRASVVDRDDTRPGPQAEVREQPAVGRAAAGTVGPPVEVEDRGNLLCDRRGRRCSLFAVNLRPYRRPGRPAWH